MSCSVFGVATGNHPIGCNIQSSGFSNVLLNSTIDIIRSMISCNVQQGPLIRSKKNLEIVSSIMCLTFSNESGLNAIIPLGIPLFILLVRCSSKPLSRFVFYHINSKIHQIIKIKMVYANSMWQINTVLPF